MRSNFFRLALYLAGLLLGTSCGFESDKADDLSVGLWRGVLHIQGQELPFNFEISKEDQRSYHIELINGEERIPIDEVYVLGDSLFVTMNLFDAQIKAQIRKDRLNGKWCKNYSPGYELAFTARLGDAQRFYPAQAPAIDVEGTWLVDFEDDSLESVGVFEQDGNLLSGTFLTSTGDYRYLQGSVSGDSIYLSTFDGEHAFLFTAASVGEDSLQGIFKSGPTWIESWSARRDSTASLQAPDSLTFLKPGYSKLQFEFPDLNGRTVSLNDAKYRNKVVIVQIFGTWCPNCIDETKYLARWYDHQRHLPLEIIGLAYERLDDYSYAKSRLNKMINKLDVKYDFLIAGNSDKEQAAETLPMLNHIMSFPTTIFLDHRGDIRRIYTGFSGPGTGKYYEEFVKDFESFTSQLITEALADTTATR